MRLIIVYLISNFSCVSSATFTDYPRAVVLKVRAFCFALYHTHTIVMSDFYDLTEEEQAELNAELEEGYADIENK